VPCIGKAISIDGKRYVWGLVHYAKDSQRAYNFSRSREIEMFALAPIAPFVATATQIGVYKPLWDSAHKKTYPWLPYVPDPEAPGPPQRLNPPAMSSAITESTRLAVDEIKATIGLFDASLGQRSNETSGVAIRARQQEGDRGSFPYIDNLGRARLLTYKILIDLIRNIYDTQRIVRIMGPDNVVGTVTINEVVHEVGPGGEVVSKVLRDMTTGRYDITMSMGASFASQRLEAAANMSEMLKFAPQVTPLIADLIVKNQDWPGAQEVSRRLKTIVPATALTEEDRKEIAKDQPQQQQQAPPDPKLIELQFRMQVETEKLKMEEARLQMEMEMHQIAKEKGIADIEQIRSTGIKNLAQAEALEIGKQIDLYRVQLEGLTDRLEMALAATQGAGGAPTRNSGPSGPPPGPPPQGAPHGPGNSGSAMPPPEVGTPEAMPGEPVDGGGPGQSMPNAGIEQP
jgi:hypothetical protein